MAGWFFKWFAFLAALLALALLVAGQAGWLAGTAPNGLGVANGRLAPPSSTPNSVSSQAGLYPDHPQRAYGAMEPLRFAGDPARAMQRLAGLVRSLERTRIVDQRTDYLRAEVTSRWLGFKDDVEFWLDPAAGVIHFRSASRLGEGDLGVNRERMETIQARWAP